MDVFRKQLKRMKIWKEDNRFNLKYEAKDGKEALDILEENSVDLVIADIKMPVINGLELLQEIKLKEIPVETVLLSEHSDFSFARNAIQYGAFDYLLKPIKEKELKEVLDKVYKYISNKKIEKTRIEGLEKEVLDKVDYYYPKRDIISLSKKVIHKDESLLNDIDILFDNLLNHFKNEEYKIRLLLDNIYMDIINNLVESCPWINLYYDIGKIEYVNSSNIEKLNSQFMAFKEQLLILSNIFGRLYIQVSKDSVKDIIEYILENIDDIVDISTIADEFYLSKNHISYIFKEETNTTLGNYIIKIKMERAKRLIQGTDMKNYEISQILNYKNPEYFEKLFKKYTNYTPSEYRKI